MQKKTWQRQRVDNLYKKWLQFSRFIVDCYKILRLGE